jgi:hypothetical protein
MPGCINKKQLCLGCFCFFDDLSVKLCVLCGKSLRFEFFFTTETQRTQSFTENCTNAITISIFTV